MITRDAALRSLSRLMARSLAASMTAALLALSCSRTPPVGWKEGGTPLLVQPARWERSSDDPVEILPDGTVLEDGDPVFTIDRVGRVADADVDPFAVLLPEGQLAGAEQSDLGHVGFNNAAPPGSSVAWLTVAEGGQVTYYDPDGTRKSGGTWRGCSGPQLRTCTLVTHLFAVRAWQRNARSGVVVGVGIGVRL
jgi:hypothetical protein